MRSELPRFNGAAQVRLAPFLAVLPTIVLGAAVAYLYLPVLIDLVAQWRSDENYSHGFLIPFVSAYLVWQRRTELQRCHVRVSIWGYAVLFLGVVLLILGEAATFGYPARLSLIVVLSGLVLFLAGPSVLRALGFPLAYLLFMVPLPVLVLNRITFPLQLIAAGIATATLDLLNIPVLREGNVIALASMRLEVTEACSGIRSLISLFSLAVIYAYLTQKGWATRSGITLSAIPIALVTNAARVALTGVLVQTMGPRVALGFYHTFSGLLIFVLAFGLLTFEGLIVSRATSMARP